jgi:hypothetical protein
VSALPDDALVSGLLLKNRIESFPQANRFGVLSIANAKNVLPKSKTIRMKFHNEDAPESGSQKKNPHIHVSLSRAKQSKGQCLSSKQSIISQPAVVKVTLRHCLAH